MELIIMNAHRRTLQFLSLRINTGDNDVDDENGNYDYLMGADVDFYNPRSS